MRIYYALKPAIRGRMMIWTDTQTAGIQTAGTAHHAHARLWISMNAQLADAIASQELIPGGILPSQREIFALVLKRWNYNGQKLYCGKR